ncbi:MAG: adenosylcobalamin-dependent ribonucleoside-diphosphate reductase [Candidatus Woesearchaeota archaeon]
MDSYNLPKKIIKRDGSIVDFDIERIKLSITKAMQAVSKYDEKNLDLIVNEILKIIENVFDSKKEPTVEELQDIIELVLMKKGFFEVAKAYIIYRNEKAKLREEKRKVLNKSTELDHVEKKFSLNSLKVLASRYLIRNAEGKIVESLHELFTRVAITSTLAEFLYDEKVFSKNSNVDKNELEIIKTYYQNYEQYDNFLKYDQFALNKYHFQRLMYAFKRLYEKGKIKIKVDEFFDLFKNHYFDKYSDFTKKLIDLMENQDFMPNTPALVNAGRRLGMLSACFTLDIEDDIESIMKTARDVALIQKMGGGTGINFSKLRPKDDVVASTSGVASGPISFIKMIDSVSEVIKQGGVRRAANMGILEVWHPDIESFIKMKEVDGTFVNFNISVGLNEDFFKSLKDGKTYSLINPRNKAIVKEENPETILNLISYYAWLIADPGVLFFDNINKRNVLKKARKREIRVTNPCGEEPLYEYESCNLASINVSNFVINGSFDWKRFNEVTKIVARALENMIEVNNYPIPEIEKATLETRRIGVGIMGLADALYKLKLKYNSQQGYEFMKLISENLTYCSFEESVELAKERGPFDLFYDSDYVNGELPIEGYYHKSEWSLDWDKLVEKIKIYGLRNAMVTTCPPTGSISMIADCSSGIEPNFALVFKKSVSVGEFYYVNPILEKELRLRNLYNDEVLKKISDNKGSLQGLNLDKELEEIFVTAMDIHWFDHIYAQAIMQRWITDSISKTINMKNEVKVDDVKAAYLFAYLLGCKGVTVYRDGSKYGQVLVTEGNKQTFDLEISEHGKKVIKELINLNKWIEKYINLDDLISPAKNKSLNLYINLAKNSNGEERCPVCKGKLITESGCVKCIECGWSKCLTS